MSNYEMYAKFYDATQGDRAENIAMIQKFIAMYKTEARTVLELACGTGSVLKGLADTYQVSGLDISPEMLAIARQKVPAAKIHRGDMSNFKLDEKYDVVLCIFDAINHLTKFAHWESLFKNTAEHLNPSGLFIFDINTLDRLKRLAKEPPRTKDFNGKQMIMSIAENPENIFNWNVEILDGAERHKEVILETSFPATQIKKALVDHFNIFGLFDNSGNETIDDSDRLWFVCEKNTK